MDDSDYYLREFVKSRNVNQVTKMKLKKVVGDIMLAQRVKRFLVNIKPKFQIGTRKARTPEMVRRQSAHLTSAKGSSASKHRGSSGKATSAKPVMGKSAFPPQLGEVSVTPMIQGLSVTASQPMQSGDSSRYRKSKSNLTDEDFRRASIHSVVSLKSNVDKMPHIVNKSEDQSGDKRPNGGTDASGSTKDAKKSVYLPALSDTLWAGDPKAISSIRRPRKNAKEMLATYKSGEDSRRLIREMTFPCTRNCHKPNLVTELDRIYVELPTIVPAIVKARQKMESTPPFSDRPIVSLLSIPAHSLGNQPSSLVTHLSERRSSVKLQQTQTVRPHGESLRQLTNIMGLGIRHKL